MKRQVSDICGTCKKTKLFNVCSEHCPNCGVVSFSTNELEIQNT